MYMLSFILITAISFCLLCIIIQMYKMNKIGKQYKEAKLHQKNEKQYL
jgi:UDP-N-acetylmuramyl pentapeptide phosphotransferase/UDP-N-acetylglucosamine-1-phosphate transferase